MSCPNSSISCSWASASSTGSAATAGSLLDFSGPESAVWAGRVDLLPAIASYEAEMIPYGFARVADSLAENGTSGNDPLHKPVLGRAVLSASRAYFKAVDKVPSLQRKFLDDLYTYRGAKESA